MKNSKSPEYDGRSFRTIETICEEIMDLAGEIKIEYNSHPQLLMWIKPEIGMPASDDELVVVKTDTGAKYFASTINGQFMKNVVAWCPLPKD